MKRSLSMLALALAAASACTQDSEQPPPTTNLRSAVTSTGAQETGMKRARGFVGNIETLTVENHDFRRVVYTGKNMQLVLMKLEPGEDIGAEVHEVDQFFRVEKGSGEVVINDQRTPVRAGSAIVVPAGARHDVVNTGKEPLQVYTLYAPPNHRDKVVHHTKADAERDTERFDGRVTE